MIAREPGISSDTIHRYVVEMAKQYRERRMEAGYDDLAEQLEAVSSRVNSIG